jgi:hypothetical protein
MQPLAMTRRRRWRKPGGEALLSCPVSTMPQRFSSSYGIKASSSLPRASSTRPHPRSDESVQWRGEAVQADPQWTILQLHIIILAAVFILSLHVIVSKLYVPTSSDF